MKNKWSVEMTKEAENKLRSDFKSGQITVADIKVIKRWISDIGGVTAGHNYKK